MGIKIIKDTDKAQDLKEVEVMVSGGYAMDLDGEQYRVSLTVNDAFIKLVRDNFPRPLPDLLYTSFRHSYRCRYVPGADVWHSGNLYKDVYVALFRDSPNRKRMIRRFNLTSHTVGFQLHQIRQALDYYLRMMRDAIIAKHLLVTGEIDVGYKELADIPYFTMEWDGDYDTPSVYREAERLLHI